MKFSSVLLATTALGPYVNGAAALPPSIPADNDVALSRSVHEHEHADRSIDEDLWKRKGGGGGGGGRGGGSSGSGGSSGGGGGRGGLGSSGSTTGGRTTTGSGPQPGYGRGGNAYYGGGASVPYAAGQPTRGGGAGAIVPFAIGGAALGFWGAYWLAGAYSYPYSHRYYYHNSTNNQNETKPVTCLCARDQECGCDDNGDQQYFNSVIGNGSYDGLNKTLVTSANVNGTDQIFINGTLPPGTTVPGGDEDPFDDAAGMLRAAAWWPIVTTVLVIAYIV